MLSLIIERAECEIAMDERILSSTSKGRPRNAMLDGFLPARLATTRAPGVYERFLFVRFLSASKHGSSDGASALLDLPVSSAVFIGLLQEHSCVQQARAFYYHKSV